MIWKLLYVPDIILMPSFAYLLVVLHLSKTERYHTPFYTFFKVTGICGIATVITAFLVTQMTYSADYIWVLQAALMINENATLGATLGKFYIALHRYCVMRQIEISETIWSVSLVRLLILLQLLLPTSISILFVIPPFSSTVAVNGTATISADNQALMIQKYVNTSVFSAYCIACALLTFLTVRCLRDLGRRLEGTARATILRQQRSMFLIVSVCCISHLLKTLQQISVLVIAAYQLPPSIRTAINWPTYALTNGLATYSPALILVARSANVRALLLRGWNWPTQPMTSTI